MKRSPQPAVFKKDGIAVIGGKEVPLTNLDKVYFPDEKITKGDVINYYQSIATYILPYLKNRPESMKRNPNGITDEGFYQKDAGDHTPAWIITKGIHSDSGNKIVDYIICNDKATLAYMNNLGCIELNPWNSRAAKPDHPDYLVMDIDPSDNNTFEQVIEVAKAVKDILDKAGAEGYCKTSGATGLHVYVPLGAKYSYELARQFCEIIATLVHEALPSFTTMERMLNKRKGNIYLDYLQNRGGQTLSSVYSLRPRPGATVSTPLDWSEVKKGLHPSQFHIGNILKRIEKKGDLFKPVLGKGIDLIKCLKKLGA